MEIYRGEPTFHIIDDQDPVYIPEDITNKIEETREQVLRSLQQGEPFIYSSNRAIGDNYLLNGAYRYVLSKFCLENGLNPDLLSVESGSHASDNLKRVHTIAHAYFNPTRHFYYTVVSKLGYALGIPISNEDAYFVPQPCRDNFYPMNYFARDRAIEVGLNLREHYLRDHQEIIVIIQGGRYPEKRFSDDQVNTISLEAIQVFPGSHIINVSDASGDDINQIAAKLYSADRVLTTDTFLGHLAAGCLAMRPDRGGKLAVGDWLGLYTLGWPDVWGVPGGHIVASPAVIAHQSKGLSSLWSIMGPDVYHKMMNNSQSIGIDPQDIELFKNSFYLFSKL